MNDEPQLTFFNEITYQKELFTNFTELCLEADHNGRKQSAAIYVCHHFEFLKL